MKTTTLTIRLSADDKQLLQTTARKCGLTVTEYLLRLLHADAGPAAEIPHTIEDLRAELAQYKADLENLHAQIAALHGSSDHTGRADRADPQSMHTQPGTTQDCNKSCKWFVRGYVCNHPDYCSPDCTIMVPWDNCPNYEPKEK